MSEADNKHNMGKAKNEKSQLTDNELVQRYREGDVDGFKILLERYQAKVYGYIFSLVKDNDTADDIFQDTFYKVIDTIKNDQYDYEGKFAPWVMGIAHSLIVEFFHNNTQTTSDTPHGEAVDKREKLDKNAKLNIRKLVKMLPPEQRRVFILRYYGKCDFNDIASRIGVSINTVLDRMRYATTNLRHWAQENNMDIDLKLNSMTKKVQDKNEKYGLETIAFKKMLEAKENMMKNCHLRYSCSLRFDYDEETHGPNQIEFLESLTTEQVKNEPLPLRLLMKNSVYYPASGLDGGVIKYCNTIGRDMGIRSFVYCDYNTNEVELCDNVANHFRGYSIFAHRSVAAEELGVKRLSMEPIDDRAKGKHLTPEEEPFCHWFIMEREDAFDDEHGPKRFSLLFLCCEGVTAYVQLYCHNEIVPTALAIIQPGTGFGGNWTDFRDCYGALAYVICHMPQGMPRWIFNGGIGNTTDANYTHLSWGDKKYAIADKVVNYYGPGEGQMVVFKRGKRQGNK